MLKHHVLNLLPLFEMSTFLSLKPEEKAKRVLLLYDREFGRWEFYMQSMIILVK